MRRFVLAVLASGFALGTAVAHADTWQATADSRGQVGLTGFVDQPARGATITRGSGFRVSGWVADPSAQGWSGVDAVQLYWGVSGDGGVQIATGLVGQSRPDVPQTTGMEYWGSSGFSIDVSGWDLKPGTNAFTVYAHTPGRGWWALPFTVTIIDPYADKSAAAQTCQEESRLIQNGIRLGVAPTEGLIHVLLDSCTAAGMTISADFSASATGTSQVPHTSGSAIESAITSDFNGYAQDQIFVLDNGQVWQQTEAWFWYWYSFRPRALIYQTGGGWKLHVDQIDHDVFVQRIK